MQSRDARFDANLHKMKSEAEARVQSEREAKAKLAVAGAVPAGSYGYRTSADASYDKVFETDLARGGDSADTAYNLAEKEEEAKQRKHEKAFHALQTQTEAKYHAEREVMARHVEARTVEDHQVTPNPLLFRRLLSPHFFLSSFSSYFFRLL